MSLARATETNLGNLSRDLVGVIVNTGELEFSDVVNLAQCNSHLKRSVYETVTLFSNKNANKLLSFDEVRQSLNAKSLLEAEHNYLTQPPNFIIRHVRELDARQAAPYIVLMLGVIGFGGVAGYVSAGSHGYGAPKDFYASISESLTYTAIFCCAIGIFRIDPSLSIPLISPVILVKAALCLMELESPMMKAVNAAIYSLPLLAALPTVDVRFFHGTATFAASFLVAGTTAAHACIMSTRLINVSAYTCLADSFTWASIGGALGGLGAALYVVTDNYIKPFVNRIFAAADVKAQVLNEEIEALELMRRP